MEKMILIKYGELTTKKSNRKQFVKTLAKNINKKLTGLKYEMEYTIDRMYIFTDEIDKVTSLLKDVFGLHSIVVAYKVSSDIEIIKQESLNLLQGKKINSFCIKTKRSDKTFPLQSLEINQAVGSYILNTLPNLKVDVKNPDIKIDVEIRKKSTYLSLDSIKGLGGFPVEMQSKGLLMLSGGIDSPVAGYMALKRGIDIECIYFESPPHTSVKALNKVEELTRILTKYKPIIKLHIVPFTNIQESVYKSIDKTYMVTILRRMMYRISEQVALNNNAIVIINGECIGQVASQTLTSMSCINEVTKMPIIRPLACFDKEEIITLARNIGTYETSILPYEDCCTIFVAKHPVINPVLENCHKFEKTIDYEEMIKDAINNIKTVIIKSDDTKTYEDLL